MTTGSIWVDEVKYFGNDDMPVYIEDSMLFDIDAIETWCVVHKGEKNSET